MILKEIKPLNWGPFSTNTLLIVEPDVTVLTASNDAGKSSLLRLLNAAYCMGSIDVVTEDDLNIHYRHDSEYQNWAEDYNLGCILSFHLDDTSKKYFDIGVSNLEIQHGDEAVITFRLAPKVSSVKVELYRAGKFVTDRFLALKSLPRIVQLPAEGRIRNEIDITSPNEAEKLLLNVAFGSVENAKKIAGYRRPQYRTAIRQAQRNLDAAINRVIPSSLQLSFFLEPTENQNLIAILPYDQQFGSAPLTSRGSGVQVLLSLLGSLLDLGDGEDHVIFCLDEPETSLHADAQHLLRGMLEDLARSSKVQVIYATHSPSMINNMRPRSVRLLQRTLVDETVVTKVHNRPIDNNFIQIRSTLGITPGDSLQFAPVTIVVEGVTEAIGMQLMLEKLHGLGVDGFENVPLLTPQCHIIDGEGDTYIRQAKFALSQKCEVVVFLDGDKPVSAATQKQLQGASIIQLRDKEEIEQLVSDDVYFNAIVADVEEQGGTILSPVNLTDCDIWIRAQSHPIPSMAFSKQVEIWLKQVTSDYKFNKPRVLRKAIDLVESADQIRADELRALVQEILKRLPSKI